MSGDCLVLPLSSCPLFFQILKFIYAYFTFRFFVLFLFSCPPGHVAVYSPPSCVKGPLCGPFQKPCGDLCIAKDEVCPCHGDDVDCTRSVIVAGRDFIIVIIVCFVILFCKCG